MSADGEKELDVYARPFVPQIFRDINQAPATIIPSLPAPTIDYSAYVRSFAGSQFLRARDNTWPPTSQPPPHSPTVQSPRDGPIFQRPQHVPVTISTPRAQSSLRSDLVGLSAESYHGHWQAILDAEGTALQSQCDDHALFRVPVTWSAPDNHPSIFQLHVPGLRESSLRIELGDIVKLRQLCYDQHGNIVHSSFTHDQRGSMIQLPNAELQTVVWRIDRRNEVLILRADGLVPGSMHFNVSFTPNQRLAALQLGVSLAQGFLNEDTADNWMRSMLFPDERDGYYMKKLNQRVTGIDFLDEGLNYEQIRAISSVLRESIATVYLIFGPPGTGKTRTLVELALQLAREPLSHLLICAPSDSAADTLTTRLSRSLTPGALLRLNATSRSFAEVPNTVLPFCCVRDTIFSLPDLDQLLKYRVVVVTCRDADILLQARVSNRDLFKLETSLHTLLRPNSSPLDPPLLHWTSLLLDEAAQAMEPETLIPMLVVAPPCGMVEERWPKFVMAGDAHQLGPRVAMARQPDLQTGRPSRNSAHLEKSLFQRISERPFFAEHPLARCKGKGTRLTQDMLPILRPAFTDLVRNYRSHPAIIATSSKQFYFDTLETEAADTESLFSWPGWKGKHRMPVLFQVNTANDAVEHDGSGWYNIQEAQMAVQICRSSVRSGLIKPKDICLIAAFEAQVILLRTMARRADRRDISIGPLTAFQGLESRLVILCTTRTRDRFIDQDLANGLGVINEPTSINVALTRARHGLIVIGNPAVLEKDPNWKAFLSFCSRNGLHDGLPEGKTLLSDGDDVGEMSRLEKMLIRQANGDASGGRLLGSMDDENRRWKSGIDAQTAVELEEEDYKEEDDREEEDDDDGESAETQE